MMFVEVIAGFINYYYSKVIATIADKTHNSLIKPQITAVVYCVAMTSIILWISYGHGLLGGVDTG